MSKSALILIGIVLWLLLSLLCFSCHRGPIQDTLSAEAVGALQAEGIELENVTFDGRIAVLTGSIASNSLSARAEEIVAAHPGVLGVRNTLNVVGAAPPETAPPAASGGASMEMRFTPQGIVLNGTVPDAATRQALSSAAAAKVGAGNVRNNLTVDTAQPTPGWLGQVQRLIPVVADSVSNGVVAVNTAGGGNVVLRGTVGRQSTKTAIGTQAARLLGQGIALDNQLQVSAAQQSLNQLLEGRKVEFVTDKAELTPESRRLLDQMAEVLRQNPNAQVSIEGHTDSRGRAAYNLELSQRRANAIRSYLNQQGIATNRLTATGYGETRPIDSNDSRTGRQRNRRVEFHVVN